MSVDTWIHILEMERDSHIISIGPQFPCVEKAGETHKKGEFASSIHGASKTSPLILHSLANYIMAGQAITIIMTWSNRVAHLQLNHCRSTTPYTEYVSMQFSTTSKARHAGSTNKLSDPSVKSTKLRSSTRPKKSVHVTESSLANYAMARTRHEASRYEPSSTKSASVPFRSSSSPAASIILPRVAHVKGWHTRMRRWVPKNSHRSGSHF